MQLPLKSLLIFVIQVVSASRFHICFDNDHFAPVFLKISLWWSIEIKEIQ